ncbi:hypothetical protein Vadar_018275 [Vaccinium darrowii]|uniref:Uncharacterized protein n=1 Tax=Vaccinium darrowii TaxID=229202 RepID=A0ACB7Y7U2_9ERIC|nr:hypothetical protein Vadar_018275 [Vaccinium darrowii]
MLIKFDYAVFLWHGILLSQSCRTKNRIHPWCVGIEKRYLVEYSGGLLMVDRVLLSLSSGKLSRTLAFEMYKFDDSIFSWVEVKDLGGESLFLGFNSSASISSSDFPECRGNCIYFSDDTTDFDYRDQIQGGRGFDMGIYNLNDGTIERFPVPVYPCDGKNLFSPLPIWVVPKL